jgi:hypothetical protein
MTRRIAILAALLTFAVTATASASVTYPDLSNNDPTYNMAAIKRAGHPAVVLKVNQGVGFLDSTFYYMAIAAKRVGVCVGGYDFVQEYTAAEAYVLIERLHAAGIYRNTPCTLPPTLDVEFGVPSQPGLEHMIAVLMREFGRVQIYTGAWYWAPHFGCWVPAQVHLWLSGYPFAPTLCGMQGWQYVVQQYADNGFNGVFSSDMNVWRGSDASFKAFAQITPPGMTAAQRRAQRTRSLHAHRKLRAQLHGLIEKHHCRHGSANPHSYHTACGRWLRHGRQEVAIIHRYEREGIR